MSTPSRSTVAGTPPCRRVDAARRGVVGMVSSHHRRVGDLHDLRRGVSLLHRQEPERTDAARGARGADLLHDLPALEQRHDSSRRRSVSGGASRGAFLRAVAARPCAGRASSCSAPRRSGTGLIYEHGLTISTNLFGTTYYSLVGLHAFHVTVGLVMLAIVRLFAGGARRPATRTSSASRCCRCTGTSSTRCGWWCSPSSTSSDAEQPS